MLMKECQNAKEADITDTVYFVSVRVSGTAREGRL